MFEVLPSTRTTSGSSLLYFPSGRMVFGLCDSWDVDKPRVIWGEQRYFNAVKNHKMFRVAKCRRFEVDEHWRLINGFDEHGRIRSQKPNPEVQSGLQLGPDRPGDSNGCLRPQEKNHGCSGLGFTAFQLTPLVYFLSIFYFFSPSPSSVYLKIHSKGLPPIVLSDGYNNL